MVKFPRITDRNDPAYEFFQSVVKTPILQGTLVKNVSFTGSGTTRIKHGLGRKPEGFIAVWLTDNVTFYVDNDNTRPESELWLVNPSGNAQTASFWIF